MIAFRCATLRGRIEKSGDALERGLVEEREMRLPRAVLDPLIRRKMPLHRAPLDRYRIFAAHRLEHYEDAFKLLHVAYVFQGIEKIRGVEMRIIPQHVLPEATVFVAYEGDSIVGTMTVTMDSPAKLPLDHDYGAAIDALREEGAKIVEYGALAVVRRCWHSGVTVLLSMAAHAFSSKVLGASHCVMGVNPKAATFYRAVYNFTPLGLPRKHAELEAPVQGMSHRLAQVESFFNKHHTKAMSSGLTVAEHFLEVLPPCVELPPCSLEEMARWKLPREVFHALFVEQSDRLDTLDPRTREHLETLRSKRTLEVEGAGSDGKIVHTLRWVPAIDDMKEG